NPFDPPLTPLKKGGDESNKTLKKGGDESDETLKKWRDQLSKLYKTGDLVRYLADGNIEYLGRMDDQVKLRGFRIELGEIQAVLRSHQGVKDAVVTVIEKDDSKSLAAYFVRNVSAFPAYVNVDSRFAVQENRLISRSDQFDFAYDIELEGESIALLSLANVLHIFDAQQRTYAVYPLSTLAYTRSEFDALHVGAWPSYFAGSTVLSMYWEKMYRYFPQAQILIKEAFDITTGIGNSVLLSWDGTATDLPKGWDGALKRSALEYEASIVPNTLVIMAGIVDLQFKDRKIAGLIVEAFRVVAQSLRLEHLIVALRPIAKTACQAMPINEYCQLKNESNRQYDGWLRLHCAAGGSIIGSEAQSQYVEGSIAQWEAWSGRTFDQTGEYFFDDTLAPVYVNIENQCAHYYDPCIWIEHGIPTTASMTSMLTALEVERLYVDSVGLTPDRVVIVDRSAFMDDPESNFSAILNGLARYTKPLLQSVELSAYLAESLSDYMRPTYLTCLPSLPLTAGGKVDRRALPRPDVSQLQSLYLAPRSKTEQILSEIWQEILGVERVGIKDNFFRLGGHSLSATRLVARINQRFQIKLPLKVVFETADLQGLALSTQQQAQELIQPPIVPVSRDQALLLSYAQQRLWMLDQIEGGSTHYHMPSALRLSGFLDCSALNRALIDIVKRHESLRTCFYVRADQVYQEIQREQLAQTIVVPMVDLSHLMSGEQNLYVTEIMEDEATRRFDLSCDLMLRVRLIRLAEASHILLITMHHIASDGWSIGVLIRELSSLYSAYSQGQENPLPSLGIQYADYAQWQRSWLQGAVLEQQLAYWVEQLADLPVVHSLPLDHPRPGVQMFVGESIQTELDVETSTKLKAFCLASGATLFMGLHAAFSVLLSRHSNERDIVIGTPIANREQDEVSALIGFFVNTLVLRSDLSGEPGFATLLDRSKQMLLDAYAHQQVPFEQIVESLQPERHLSHSPLFQVMLILQNNEHVELELPELKLSSVERGAVVAKYELSLNVTESEQNLQLSWV
ncbi:MAG: AMP-binding protein, partial [Undibacterium sp.]|nr:AMP-binding protein [Undibacterium sp.]